MQGHYAHRNGRAVDRDSHGAERTLELLEAQVGRPLDEIETPAAVVDLDRLEANLQRLQSYADSHGIAMWPHTKTHKSPEIGLRQLALGAGGLTVAKTGEAEVFHEAGAPRLLVHYPPFGADKWERLARLAAEGLELTVAVDSVAPAAGLVRGAATARRDRGAPRRARRRSPPNRPGERGGRARTSRKSSRASRRSRWPGSAAIPGHCRGDAATIRSRVVDVDAFLQETRDAFAAAGIRSDRISGGSTPTRYLTHETCVNELRAGTYSLLDRVDGPSEPDGGLDACALWVEVTVVSDAVPDRS